MKRILSLLLLSVVLFAGCGSPSNSHSSQGPVITSSTLASTAPTSATTYPALVNTSAPPGTETSATSTPQPARSLTLEQYDGGFFSIQKPADWDVVTAGSCSTFAFCIRDKHNPANQIFYFNEVGPVYLAEEQKTVDKNYMDMGGYAITWYQMPVVNPLTPENFLANFYLVTRTDIAQQFMSGLPDLEDVQVISAVDETSPISGGQTQTIRALFRENGVLGEGLFYVTVAPVIPLTGMPAGGIGYGFCFTGITSVQSDFRNNQQSLLQSLNSLNVSQAWVNSCLNQQQQQYQGTLKAGRTLSETSDIIAEVWQNRDRSEDIITEKMSDVILGNSRVYDPDTGTVYEVPLDFYDNYNINRQRYNMDNLQLLPDNDWNLWTAPTEPANDID